MPNDNYKNDLKQISGKLKAIENQLSLIFQAIMLSKYDGREGVEKARKNLYEKALKLDGGQQSK